MSSTENYANQWEIKEQKFDSKSIGYYGSIFTLGNGYLGTRGSLEEEIEGSLPATFIAGVFDKAPEHVTELANVANWLSMNLFVDECPVNPQNTSVQNHERTLNLKHGILHRSTTFKINSGLTVDLKSQRFASVEDVHTMGINYQLTFHNLNGQKKKVKVKCALDGSVTNQGVIHFDVVEKESISTNTILIQQKGRHSAHHVVEAAAFNFNANGKEAPVDFNYEEQLTTPILNVEFIAEEGVEYTIEKIVAIFTSRESKDPQADALNLVARNRKKGFAQLLIAHQKIWEKRWEISDMQIEGDDFAQLAVRFSIFHLLQASSETDDRISIAAKALSGFGYKGHVFWDTELFILPYLNYTNPNLSRNMLLYRYHTLEAAKRKAAENGYRGAMYAWESADTGEETTPKWVKHLSEDRKIRIWCGENEQHINSDIAYGIWQYYLITANTDFFVSYGAEIILETARFWYSRVEYNTEKDRFEIKKVIGPDEYHENINNNAFTNATAKWNIAKALEIIKMLKEQQLTDWQRVQAKMDLKDSELDGWRNVMEKIYIPFDRDRKLFIQFDGFMELENIDLNLYKNRTEPMDVVLGIEKVQRSQIGKQPDVLMLLNLFLNEYSAEIKQTNWDYYEPRCGHGSSLSPAIHCIVACDLGLTEKAYMYFMQAVKIDLGNKMSNTIDGIHAATAGSLLQAVLFGFAGLRIQQDGFILNPKLPRHWKSLKFNIFWRGRCNSISIQGEND